MLRIRTKEFEQKKKEKIKKGGEWEENITNKGTIQYGPAKTA